MPSVISAESPGTMNRDTSPGRSWALRSRLTVARASGPVLLICSITALLLGLVLWLATLVGPLLAGVIVAAVLVLTGLILVKVGINGLKALGGDEAEREALAHGDERA